MRQIKTAGRPATGVVRPTYKWFVEFEYTSIVVDATDKRDAILEAQAKILGLPHPSYCKIGLDEPILVRLLDNRHDQTKPLEVVQC